MRHLEIFENFIRNKFEYTFTEDGVEYKVSFYKKSDTKFSVGYGIVDEEEIKYFTLNKDNTFKVINQVVACIKDFIKLNPEVNYIEFSGVPDSKFDWMIKLSRNIYLTYIVSKLYNILSSFTYSKRSHIFSRWAEREAKDTNWKVEKFGNKIILRK